MSAWQVPARRKRRRGQCKAGYGNGNQDETVRFIALQTHQLDGTLEMLARNDLATNARFGLSAGAKHYVFALHDGSLMKSWNNPVWNLRHVHAKRERKPPIHFDERATGPLDGVRVLDLSRLVAGNMLSLQLGDFGADVIKVEPPAGDPLRDWRDGVMSSIGRPTRATNARSCSTSGMTGRRTPLLRMVARARVHRKLRPEHWRRWGLGPDILFERNPDLIIVRVSGSARPALMRRFRVRTLVEAMSGIAARTGFPDREPVLPPWRSPT